MKKPKKPEQCQYVKFTISTVDDLKKLITNPKYNDLSLFCEGSDEYADFELMAGGEVERSDTEYLKDLKEYEEEMSKYKKYRREKLEKELKNLKEA